MEGMPIAFVWVDAEDRDEIHERIIAVGELMGEEKEDPSDTGEPYRLVQRYQLVNDGLAEIYWLDVSKKKLGDIRLIVPVDPEEEKRMRVEHGLPAVKSLEEALGDVHSSHLTEYMRSRVDRILG